MDILTFVATIIGNTAWPIFLIVILVLYRKSFAKLIDSIKLRSIKRGDIEFNFEQELTQIKTKVDSDQFSKPSPKSKTLALTGNKKEESLKFNQAKQIAQINPRASVALSWIYVEQELHSTVMRLAISPDPPSANSSIKNIQLLKDNGALSGSIFEYIHDLRKLRNDAIHNVAEPGISYLHADQYAELAEFVIDQLKTIKRK